MAPGVPAKLGEQKKLFMVVQSGWQTALKQGKWPACQQGVAAMLKN